MMIMIMMKVSIDTNYILYYNYSHNINVNNTQIATIIPSTMVFPRASFFSSF